MLVFTDMSPKSFISHNDQRKLFSFTIEEENNNQIAFLDVLVTRMKTRTEMKNRVVNEELVLISIHPNKVELFK